MKFSTIMNSIVCGILFFSANVFAQQNGMKIGADLMIHPEQMSGFFNMATKKVTSSQSWDWPSMQFTKPYKTSWTNVQAMGPFNIHFNTDQLGQREFAFELEWNNPVIKVGQFEIHDTIVRQVGGGTFTVYLDGRCSNMTVQIPDGGWRVKGKMRWDWQAQKMAVSWVDFNFDRNEAATAQVDLGQCEGPLGLQARLHEAIQTVVKDRAWLTDVLQDGVLDWVDGSLGTLQSSLMQGRTINLKQDLTLNWQPTQLIPQANGLLRVAGDFLLSRAGVNVDGGELVRNYSDDLLSRVTKSGFILPRNTVQKVLEFLYMTGDLQYRVQSKDVEGFQGLMQSRFMQFFVWPDLMKFAKDAQFYFDLGLQAAPVLSGGVNAAGGVVYNVAAPVIVHQWAPGTTQYLPYVDFTSPMQGKLSAQIKEGHLSLQLKSEGLNMAAAFRPEFQAFRAITKRLQTSMLNSRVEDYLDKKTFDFDLNDWQVGENFSIGLSGLDQRDQTLRIPLEFKESNSQRSVP